MMVDFSPSSADNSNCDEKQQKNSLPVVGLPMAVLYTGATWIIGAAIESFCTVKNEATAVVKAILGEDDEATEEDLSSDQLALNSVPATLAHPPCYYLKFRSTELIEQAMYLWVSRIVIVFYSSFPEIRPAKKEMKLKRD